MKKNIFKIFGVCVIVILATFIILYSPLFNVKDVVIVGNKTISSDVIKKSANLSNTNFFSINSKSIKKILIKNNFLKDVNVIKKFPNSITLDIIERKPSGYVKYLENSFLYIDEDGMVLEILPAFKDTLPLVVGLNFKDFAVGKILEVENKDSFEKLVDVVRIINNNDMLGQVSKIDLTNKSQVHIYINNTDFYFNTSSDTVEKILVIKEVIKTTPALKEIKASVNLETNIVDIIT